METFTRIKKLLATQVGKDSDTITNDTTFEDLLLDSLDIIETIMHIEKMFQIVLEDEEYMLLTSVGELVSLVNLKIPGNGL